MRSACFFWPGSEAEIAGKRPSYYLKFDNKLDDKKRVEQVLAWLALPPEQRPHFITLYYANVDHEGHEHGPDSDEVRAAVHHVDEMIGDLQAGIAASKLPVDLIVVADHGMVTLQGDPIDLSAFADLSGVHTEGSLIYAKDDAETEKIYEQFKAHPDPRFSVYRRTETPRWLHYYASAREGDPIIVPNGPYTFRTKPLPGGGSMSGTLHGGHGFDATKMPEMKAIFFADGPDIKPNTRLRTFENVDVYPFVTALLGLDIPYQPVIDGNIGPLLAGIAETANPVREVGGRVSAPVLTHLVAPKYSEQARKAKISGEVLVDLIVDKDGMPTRVRVLRGLGMGLDEIAADAVKRYRFKPAMEGGQAVPVEINISVNFRIY